MLRNVIAAASSAVLIIEVASCARTTPTRNGISDDDEPARVISAEQFQREAEPLRENVTVSSELILAYNVVLRFRSEKTSGLLTDEERNEELFDYDFKFVRFDNGGSDPLVQVVMMPVVTNILQSAHLQGKRRIASYVVDLNRHEVVCWDNFGPVMRHVPGLDDCPEYRIVESD